MSAERPDEATLPPPPLGRRELLLAGATAALAACGRARGPDVVAPSGSAPPLGAPAPDVPGSRPEVASGRFAFRVGAWIHLHHVLFDLGVKASGPDAWSAPGLEAVDGSTLPPRDAATWAAAVEAYRAALATRDPVRDPELAALHGALADRGSAPELGELTLPAELRRHLEATRPLYEARWWARHQEAAAAWRRAVGDALARHEDDLATDLARVLRQPWPAEATPVDLCAFAGWAGAYSTLGPTRIYLSTLDARNQGTAGVEVLFHEAAHGLIRPVRDAIGEAAKARGKQPRDLWHVVLFVTAGELVRRRFPGHVPYGEKEGLYAQGPWRAHRAAVDTGWMPYLEGKTDFDAAIGATVAALPAPAPTGR